METNENNFKNSKPVNQKVSDLIITKLKQSDPELTAPDPTKLLTISELRHELGIPLILARKLIVWGLIGAVQMADGSLRISATEIEEAKKFLKSPWKRIRLYIKALGPGLITGASDDDPGGIGTYSAVGAKYGFGLLWMAAWLLPMMIAIQETCARIGIVTNKGLAHVLKKHFNKKIVFGIVMALIIANIINIGADIGAMAASLKLIVPVNFILATFLFTAIIIAIELTIPYYTYVKVLKWLTLSVFAYIVTGILIKPDWILIFREVIIPDIQFQKEYIFAMIAVFGTTITPYLFFWQTSEEVEENRLAKEDTSKFTPYRLRSRIARMRTDVNSGMILANLVFFFIIITCAQVLFKNGITEIETAEQAAEALRPFAGNYAFLLFALGIIGTGLLAVPILAGSGAYALAELMNWKEGLDRKLTKAKGFYLVISASIVAGLLINFIGINPLTALYYSAWLNGIISIPLLFVIMVIGNDKRIMGRETHPKWVKVFGWGAVAFAVLSVITLIFI